MANTNELNLRYLWLISLVAAMGGFLFGYDWVVIGGAKPFYEAYFNLVSPASRGWGTSSALVGCLVGAVISGIFSDRYGRRILMLFAGIIFIVSSIGVAFSNSFFNFVLFRIIGGVAIGMASNLSPIYISEISPAKYRGRFVSMNQLTIVMGVLAAQLVNWLISRSHEIPDPTISVVISDSWNGRVGWRWMFAVCALPSLLFFIFLLFIPESPRWLVKENRYDKAFQVLNRIGGKAYAENEIRQIEETLKKTQEFSKFAFREIFGKKVLRIIAIGMFLAFFQQWCGINVIFYYADEVFTAAGFVIQDVMFNIVVTGLIMMIFTFVAIGTIDKYGRKILLLMGSIGLSISYLFIGFGYSSSWPGIIILLFTLMAIAFYSFSLAPIVWVLLSEIFPNRIRGIAMSIAVFTLWTGSFTLSYSFPQIKDAIGTSWTFWIYSIVCLIGFFFIKTFVAETKGKSLEEIESESTL